jgi:thiol-disulfide isomerase/thioredoxin
MHKPFTLLRLSLWALLLSILLPQSALARDPVDFALTTTSGEQKMLSDYRGRWVIVNYWATWCPPCRKEIPELDMFNENNENAVVLGINFEDISTKELDTFVEQQFISYPIFHQRPKRETPFGNLSGLPSTYVITPKGVPVAMQSGGITADRLERFIKTYEAQTAEPVADVADVSDGTADAHVANAKPMGSQNDE